MKLNKKNSIWLACAIDCDGNLFFKKKGKKNFNRCSICVCNTSLKLILLANKIMKGSIYKIPFYESDIKRKKLMYRAYQGHHEKCLVILNKILPYLIVKKQYAIKMIKFIETTIWGKWTKESKKRHSKRITKLWKKRKEKK